MMQSSTHAFGQILSIWTNITLNICHLILVTNIKRNLIQALILSKKNIKQQILSVILFGQILSIWTINSICNVSQAKGPVGLESVPLCTKIFYATQGILLC